MKNNSLKIIIILLMLLSFTGISIDSAAQCTNNSNYGNLANAPAIIGATSQFSACNYAGEYSTCSAGFNVGHIYSANITVLPGAYITVRQGAYNGAVVAFGPAPLTFAAPTTGPLYFHWNTNISCGTQNSCYTTTLTYVSAGAPPTVSSFTPLSGCAQTQTVTITGTDFTGVTAVQFGGVNAASYTVVNSTQINAIPASGATGTISVTTPLGTGTSAGTFTVNPSPAIPTVTANPTAFCNGLGGTSQLNAISAGNTIRWYSDSVGGTLLGTSASGVDFPQTIAATTKFWAAAYNGTCESPRTPVTVYVSTPPNLSITQDPLGPACGVNPTLTAVIPGAAPVPGTRYYIRDADPWGTANYTTAMNAVFGAGNWTALTYAAANPATVFVPGTQFVYIEGSDANAIAMNTYITANIAAIEAWVNNGGRLLMNAAPNGGANMNWGFGGTTLNYNNAQGTVNVDPGHPIVSGPFTPAGPGPFTGSSYSHAHITGTGLTPIITGGGYNVLASKTWGNGLVLFGGYTSPNYHSPSPNVQNIFQNWINYTANSPQGPAASYLWAPNGETTVSISATATGIYTVTATQSGCSATATISVTLFPLPSVTATASPDTLCQGQSTALSATGTAVSYTWNPGALAGANVTATPISTTTYTVMGTDANGCTKTSAVVINVKNNPVMTGISASPDEVCPNGTTSLTASATILTGQPGPGNYNIDTIPFAPTTPVGPATNGPSGDDIVQSGIPIGFTFPFYGTNYTTISASTNGFFSFDPSPGAGCCSGQTLPNASTPNNLVALGWADLTAPVGAITYYNLTSPNRFVIRYNVPEYGYPSNGPNAQAILYETGEIEIHTTSLTTGGHNMTQGIENANGTLATPVPGYNGAYNPPPLINKAYRFSQTAVLPVSNYAWSPAVGGAIVNPNNQTTDANPPSTTVYTVTATASNGCTITSTVTVNTHNLVTGTGSATPDTICEGGSSIISGNVPTICPGGTINGFTGGYVPANWNLDNNNSNGTINGAGAPATMSITSGTNLSALPGDTRAKYAFYCPGTVTFDWAYSHPDAFGSIFDYPQFAVNGGAPSVLNGFIVGGSNSQNGSQTVTLNANDTLYLIMSTIDNDMVPGTVTFSNFVAPTPAIGGVASIWDSPVGGINLGGPSISVSPLTAGTYNYYVEYTTLGSGCVNPARDTVELTVITGPTATASITPATTCNQTSATPTAGATGGLAPYTFAWSGGLTDNTPFVANANGTYTATATDANGCSATSTAALTVTAASGIIAPVTSNHSQDHGDDFDINYYDASCDLIATVDDGMGGNVLGLTTATVNVEATAGVHNGQPFVRRWYQITPTSNGSADVILYINQSDFDDYNTVVAAPYLALPTGPADVTGIANIRITKNDDGGLGNNPIVITPSVNWNGTYWELSFNTPSFSQFRVHSVNAGNVPLPATVISFTGEKQTSRDLLSWTTASEQNNAYFNLQHSTDGITFNTIAQVNSKGLNGNSQVRLEYQAENAKPQLGHNYYRLEQVDIDGRVSVHAKVIDLIWGADGSSVNIYPNPTTDVLNVDLYAPTAQNTSVKVLDMSGRVVKQIDAKSQAGANHIQLSLGEIASGVYTVQVYSNNKLSFTSKVRKND